MGTTLHYKHSRFTTRLPVDYRYSPSHTWIARVEGESEPIWRVGFTKFATRMLGEMVDHGFEVKPDDQIKRGKVLGWVEGFKAISDLFCILDGEFVQGNPRLKDEIELISKRPYDEGWLYEGRGTPDANCVSVESYSDILDKTIERILAQQQGEEIK